MIYATHLLFAILVMFLSSYLYLPFSPEGILLVSLGALVPDLDHPSSYINRKSWRLFSLSGIVTHRGWAHSLIGSLVFTFAFYMVARGSGFAELYPFFFLGYISHLILDSLNPSGVAWFWPKRKRYSFGIVKTGSLTEGIIQILLFCLILFLVLIF